MIKKIGASWAWIALLFALTLIVRYYAIENAPFDKGYFDTCLGTFTNVECSVHNRFIANVWEEYSPVVHHYTLSIVRDAFRMSPNKYDDSFCTYTSFPPIAFLIPYFVGKIFGVSIDFYNRWMQIWSLFLNLLCAILIYQLAQRVIAPKDEKQQGRAMLFSLVCVTLYLFNPNVLHFTSNVYWAHQFYQPVLLLFLIWQLRKRAVPDRLPVIFAWAFGLSIITWTGIMTCGAWFLAEFFLSRKDKKNWMKLAAIFAGTVSALVVNVLWISSTIEGGIVTMGRNIWVAFTERSVEKETAASAVSSMLHAISWEYLPTILFLLVCIVGLAWASKKSSGSPCAISAAEYKALIIAFLTCCESLILLNHDLTYGFGRYKYIVFLLFVIMLLFKKLNAIRFDEKKVMAVLCASVSFVSVWNIVHYLMVYSSNFSAYTS